MKKTAALLIASLMLFGLASCGGNPDAATSDVSTASTQNTSGGDTSETNPTYAEVTDVDGDGVIRVVCLGDSITQGNEGSNWPEFLQNQLDYLGSTNGKTYKVYNGGKAGAAVHHVTEKYELDGDGDNDDYFYYDDPKYTDVLKVAADVCIIQFGSNDGLSADYVNYFVEDYKTYLIKPFADMGAKVVVATPPYATNGVVDERVNGEISRMCRDMAAEQKLQMVDMNKITRYRRESFPDGIHGNVSGYELISQTYFNQIFGGKLKTVSIKTQANAMIECGKYMTTADGSGNASFTMLEKGTADELPIKITCSEFKTINDTVKIDGDTSLTCEMTPGAYNVAQGKTVTASSVCPDCDGGGNAAEKAVDGNEDTRWESKHSDNQWIMVDLGRNYSVNAVNIVWEGAYSSEYNIEVSTDGASFTKAASASISKEGLEATNFDEVSVRYIRINCVKRGTWFGNSIRELRVLTDTKE